MSALQPVLVLSGDVSGTLVGVSKMSVTWSLGAPEQMSYTVNGENAGFLTPGVAPSGTRIIGFSLDGGTSIDARMLSGGTQANVDLPVTASEAGQSIGQILGTTYTHRLTAQQITLADVFNGIKGTVVAGTGRVLTPGGVLPNFAGVSYIPTAISFLYYIDNTAASVVLDIDSNRDKIIDIVQAVCARLGSYIDPQKAQYYIDSGDLGIAGGPSVIIGYKGGSPYLTWTDPVDDTSTQPILTGSQIQPQTLATTRYCSLTGGSTPHGMPLGGKITDLVTVNHNANNGTGNYRSGMPVLAIYGDRNNGGVYYWPGDGALHPMSQAMGVNFLWYDDSLPLIYAATDAGVYQHSPDPGDTAPWARLGGMALKVKKVLSTLGRVYALVEFPNSGIPHVLMYAGAGTGLAAPPTGYGYDGWQSIYGLSGLQDFGVQSFLVAGQITTTLYALSSSATGYVIKHVVELPGSAPLPADTLTKLGGFVGIGMDCTIDYAVSPNGARQAVITQIYIRTDAGSAGVLLVGGGVLNTNGMTDAQHNTVMVNQITQHNAGTFAWDGGLSVAVTLLAATSAGVFVSSGGGGWLPTDGQNNLGDTNITHVASAPPSSWLGVMQTAVYGTDGAAFYSSRDGLLHSEQALAKNLDAGPAFFAAYKQNTGSYPGSTDTTMKYPHWTNGPYTVHRVLDGIGQFAYIMENPLSTAPADAARFDELSQVSTPSQVAEIPNSTLLLDGMARFLAYTEKPQGIFEIHSLFWDTGDPLRTLRPTDQAGINGTVQSLIIGASPTPIVFTNLNAVVWVLEHSWNYDADVDDKAVTTVTKCAYLLLDDRSDPAKIDSDLAQRISRMALYSTGRS